MPSPNEMEKMVAGPAYAELMKRQFPPYQPPTPQQRAEAEIAARYVARQMPEDIRARARSWRMEAFCEVLWSNAFMAGYREGMQERTEAPDDRT